MELYPLGEKHREFIRSKSGKALTDINMKAVMEGTVTAEDIKISKEVLMLQAEVARADGKKQLAKNFIRSAELIDIPDERVLDIYNMLRPHRATESDLENLITELENTYDAMMCADLVRETKAVYKKRDLLK